MSKKRQEYNEAWKAVEDKHDDYFNLLSEEEAAASEEWIIELQCAHGEATIAFNNYWKEQTENGLKQKEKMNQQLLLQKQAEEIKKESEHLFQKKKTVRRNIFLFNH